MLIQNFYLSIFYLLFFIKYVIIIKFYFIYFITLIYVFMLILLNLYHLNLQLVYMLVLPINIQIMLSIYYVFNNKYSIITLSNALLLFLSILP